MMLTLEEIRERLMKLDEITLCEVLEIDSEELVERFFDKIEIKLQYFALDLEDEKED